MDATAIRHIKLEASYDPELEVKEEPLGVAEYDSFSEHELEATNDSFCDSEYALNEEEIEEFSEYEIGLEIQEESVAENYFYGNRTEIPIHEDEIIFTNSNSIEETNDELQTQEEYSTNDEKRCTCAEEDYSCAYFSTNCNLWKTDDDNDDKCYNCYKCDFSSMKLQSFSHHLRKHASKKSFKSTDHNFKMDEQKNMESDNNNKRYLSGKLYLCPKCNFCTESSTVFKGHLRKHSSKRSYKCSACNNSYSRLRDLKVHYMKHRDKMPYQCTECSYYAMCPTMFNLHLREHEDNKLLKCTECCFCAASKLELDAHMKEHKVLPSGDVPDEDVPVFNVRKKKIEFDDEEWRPKSKVRVTGSRSTRQGVHEPDLRRALFESTSGMRNMHVKEKAHQHKKRSSYNLQSSSTSFSSEEIKITGEKKRGPSRRRRVTTAKQRLAKILKIR